MSKEKASMSEDEAEDKADQTIPELRVLNSPNGKKAAEKLFIAFFGDEDFGRLPAFLHSLDQILSDYGSKGLISDQEDKKEKEDEAAQPEGSDVPTEDNRGEEKTQDETASAAIQAARKSLLGRARDGSVLHLLRRMAD